MQEEKINKSFTDRGSLFETFNHLIDAFDENYITKEDLSNYKKQVNSVEVLLNGYISWLRKMSKQQPN
jgi:four helix bundle protein